MSTGPRPLVAFVLLAFLFSWTAWGLLAVLGTEPGLNVGGVLWLLGGLGPPIAAIAVARFTDDGQSPRQLLRQILRWRVGWRWYAIAIGLPGLVVISALVIDAYARGSATPLPHAEFVLFFVGVFVVNTIIGGGLEEIGWRGFALPRLQASLDAFTASLVIGVVWMIWHAPLFVVPGVVQADLPVLPFVVQGIALAVVFTWVYNGTRGSLLLVILLHGSVNTWLSAVWLLRDDVDPLTFWTMALLVCAIAVGLVVVYGAKNLSRTVRQTV